MAEQTVPLSDDQATASNNVASTVCQICNESMTEGQDLLIISQCLHSFHRECIESHLSINSQCPVCQHPCQLNDLRNYILTPKRPPMSKQRKEARK